MKNWHDVVNNYREDQLEPCLMWLIKLLKEQQAWSSKPDDFHWHFPDLDHPSEQEIADIRKKYAEIDAIYIDRGGIDTTQAWQARFGTGQFHRDIKLPDFTTNEIVEVDDDK